MKERLFERKFRSRLRQFGGMPPLTGAVNLFFILLMFFIIASSFAQVSGIYVELPEGNAPGMVIGERSIVSITAEENGISKVYFNDRLQNWNDLAEQLGKAAEGSMVILIRADRNARHETVAKVQSMVARAGLNSFVVLMPAKGKTEIIFAED